VFHVFVHAVVHRSSTVVVSVRPPAFSLGNHTCGKLRVSSVVGSGRRDLDPSRSGGTISTRKGGQLSAFSCPVKRKWRRKGLPLGVRSPHRRPCSVAGTSSAEPFAGSASVAKSYGLTGYISRRDCRSLGLVILTLAGASVAESGRVTP